MVMPGSLPLRSRDPSLLQEGWSRSRRHAARAAACCFEAVLLAILLGGCRAPAPPEPPGATKAPPRVRFSFQDVARKAGLQFRWGHGGKTPLTNLESFGCGCAFWDFDGDGWLDILLVGEPVCALYRNVPGESGGRRFADVTRSTRLDRTRGPWKGCAVADWDDDGDLDLFLSGYHTAALLRNDSGRLVDVTRAAGLRHAGWGSSAGFADYDRDGDLDLFVGNYVKFGPGSVKYCTFRHGVRGGCPPRVYPAEKGVLYRNDGGRFRDVTARAGMSDTHGKTLAIGWCDYDDDGDPDLYLANDGELGDLYRNEGGRFTNVGILTGTAFGLNHQAQAGMGVDWADYDRDGRFDLVVTAFSDESYSLYRNLGGFFRNVSAEAGIAAPTFKPLGFGCRFLDVDNDGWPDLVFANGHVYDQAGKMDPLTPYRQTTQLFRNEGPGRAGPVRFTDVSAAAGEPFRRPIVGRGLATGDFDADGRVDLLVVDYEGAPLLLRNTSETPHHWLRLRLDARGPRNRFAYGARVIVEAGAARYVAEVSPVVSYLSSSDPRPHFGLGAAAAVDDVVVHWPDGLRERFAGVLPDRETLLRRGDGEP